MASEQGSFAFVEDLPKAKKEPPRGTITESGLTFKLYKYQQDICPDCRTQNIFYAVVFEGKKFVSKRNVCVSKQCLYNLTVQLRS